MHIMWVSLVLAATLATGQSGDLKLTNPRATYGYLGPPRTDDKFLPGDVYFITFDIEGLKVSDTGEVNYKMGMAIKDKAGKEFFSQEPILQKALISLGG